MSRVTKDPSEFAPHESAAQLFDRISAVFTRPSTLNTPDTFARALQEPFRLMAGIPRAELEAVRTVVTALSSHIDSLVWTEPADDRLQMAIAKVLKSVEQAAHDETAVLEKDAEVRGILDAARQGQAASMSTQESVREGATLLASMRAKSAATLVARIESRELITSKELQDALQIRRQSISDAVKTGRLFAIVGPSGENYYPAFYTDDSLDRRAIEKVSKAMGTLPATSKYVFFTSRLSTLGATPLEALRKGRLAEVLVAASAFAVS